MGNNLTNYVCYKTSIEILDTEAQVSYLVSNIVFIYYHTL